MAEPAALPGWNTHLFIHAKTREAPAVASLNGHERLGAVFVTANPTEAAQAVAAMRASNVEAPVTFDASHYSGKNRKFARAGIDSGWIAAQHAAGATWALTDSGYIGEGDAEGLRAILAATRQIDNRSVAVLPLAGSWWDDGDVNVLINEVGDQGVPVALVLEHADDPFSVIRTVRGVVAFLAQVQVPVLILRCDLSGLGVLAFGGTAAALGTSSSLRHLYPVPARGGFGRPSQTSMVWPRGRSYRSVDKLTDAIAADPDAPHWLCECSVCYGRSIEWILNSRDQHTNAFLHSAAASCQIAHDLVSPAFTPEERQLIWLEGCRAAQGYAFDVADTSGKAWEPPKALAAWNRAVPARVS